MLQAAINFFKRNPTAKACHVVLDNAFGSVQRANAYKLGVRATKVTTYTRKEYDAYFKNIAKDSIAEPAQNEQEARP